jgi:phosphonate transport system permease protein
VVPGLLGPTIDTLLMAFFATMIIAIVVPPIVWLSANNISPNRFTVLVGRGIVICSRSIHELVWGLLFVIAVGLGRSPASSRSPFAASASSPRSSRGGGVPRHAADRGAAASGAGPLKVLILAVIPQIMPVYVGTLLFQCELDCGAPR